MISARRDKGVLRAVGSIGYRSSDFTLSARRAQRHHRQVPLPTAPLRRGGGAQEITDLFDYDDSDLDDRPAPGTTPDRSVEYLGERGCDGPGEPMSVRIPPELAEWGVIGTATALALLLDAG